METVCPIDKKDDAIQRVSAILTSGISTGSFSGPSGGFISMDGKSGSVSGYTHLSGASMTELAKLLAPPPAPKEPTESRRGVGLALSCAGVLGIGGFYCISIPIAGLIGSNITSDTGQIIFLAWLCIYFVALGIFCFFLYRRLNANAKNNLLKAQAKYAEDKPRWDQAIEKWNRLYYCHRHGIVFDPDDGTSCEPASLKEFLYKAP
jgi:hypothetical protein